MCVKHRNFTWGTLAQTSVCNELEVSSKSYALCGLHLTFLLELINRQAINSLALLRIHSLKVLLQNYLFLQISSENLFNINRNHIHTYGNILLFAALWVVELKGVASIKIPKC